MAEPDFQLLRIFFAVAEARSYRRAALALGLSPSAVSQAMRRLEAQLGIALLNRSTRSVALTAAGQRLLDEAGPALQSLSQTFAGLGELRAEVSGALRLSVPRSAARLCLMPLLARFHRLHPLVQVELSTQDGLVDIVELGFDAGVRFTERLPADMVALPLGPAQRFIVVGTPELIQSREAPQQPVDLNDWPCIRQRFASGALFRWAFAVPSSGQTIALDVSGPLTVDDQSVALRAALDGLGLAYVYETAAQEALKSGRLQQVLPEWTAPGTGFALYYPGRRQASPALRAFIEMLRAMP